jgi:hypothetical protein
MYITNNNLSWYEVAKFASLIESDSFTKEASFWEKPLAGALLWAAMLIVSNVDEAEAAKAVGAKRDQVSHVMKDPKAVAYAKERAAANKDKIESIKKQLAPKAEKAEETPANFIARVLYAESANVPAEERVLIAQLIKNRIGNPAFGSPGDAISVVKQRNAFTSINDSSNKQFAKASNPEKMKPEERLIWQHCLTLGQSLVDGSLKSDPSLQAYHDKSISKPKSWQNNKYYTYTAVKNTSHYVFYKVEKKAPVAKSAIKPKKRTGKR